MSGIAVESASDAYTCHEFGASKMRTQKLQERVAAVSMPVAAFVSHVPLRGCAYHAFRRLTSARPATMRLRPATISTRVRAAARTASTAWKRADTMERLMLAGLAAGAAGAAGAAALALAHATTAVALFALPIVLLPVVLALGAAMGALLFVALMGTGALVLAPWLAVAALVKLVSEVAIFAALATALFFALRPREKPGAPADETVADNPFRAFDRALHERGTGERDVGTLPKWSVDDVVDELVAAGMPEFAGLFERERVDGAVLLSLRQVDVREEFAGRLTLGERTQLWWWVSTLQERHMRL